MNEKRLLADLAALIAIPSLTGEEQPCRQALDFVLRRAQEMGMRTGITREGDAGWAEIGEGSVTLGILAHVDVVGVGDMEKWRSDPFTLTEKDGQLYGRGVEDDKGPVLQCLYGMAALLEEKVPLRKKIRLIVGTGEESCWTDMVHYKEQFGTPDYGFSPDAAFPVYHAEKGYADATLTFDAPELAELTAGDSPNTVPSFARLRYQDGRELTATGVSVHSSAPEKGDNAILRLAEKADDAALWRFLREMFSTDCPAVVLGLDDGSDTYQGVCVGTTVCAPTVLSLKDGKAVLNINIRFRPGVTAGDLQAAFDKLAAEYGFGFTLKSDSEPMLVPPDKPFIRAMNEVGEQFGIESGCYTASGATYCSAFPNHVGWGPTLPPDEGSAHEENEHTARADFFRVAEVYAAYLRRSAQEVE